MRDQFYEPPQGRMQGNEAGVLRLPLGCTGMSKALTVPTVFWALSATTDSVEALLAMVYEYSKRMGQDDLGSPRHWDRIPIQALSALKVLYTLVRLRTVDAEWFKALHSRFAISGDAAPEHNERVQLARPHEAAVGFTSAETLARFLPEHTPTKDPSRSHLDWWEGDVREFLVLIHLVGRFASERWQWPPSKTQRATLLTIASVFNRRGKGDRWVHHTGTPFVVYVAEAEAQLALAAALAQ